LFRRCSPVNHELPSFRIPGIAGIDRVTILGVLGESGRMVDSEREQLIRTAVEETAGRIPVIVVAAMQRGFLPRLRFPPSGG